MRGFQAEFFPPGRGRSNFHHIWGGKMLKKLFVGVVAAGVLSVPLAGVAGADPDPATNPGVPGTIGAPGQTINTVAQMPGSTAGFFRDFAGVNGPGGLIKTFT